MLSAGYRMRVGLLGLDRSEAGEKWKAYISTVRKAKLFRWVLR